MDHVATHDELLPLLHMYGSQRFLALISPYWFSSFSWFYTRIRENLMKVRQRHKGCWAQRPRLYWHRTAGWQAAAPGDSVMPRHWSPPAVRSSPSGYERCFGVPWWTWGCFKAKCTKAENHLHNMTPDCILSPANKKQLINNNQGDQLCENKWDSNIYR